MKPTPEQSCSCTECKDLCKRIPGWFKAPKEVKETAKFFNLSPKEFFNKYLVVGMWHGWGYTNEENTEGELEDINILAPSTITYTSGRVSMFLKKDTCIFYKEGRCEIHEVKPFECGMHKACDEENTKVKVEEIAKEWGKLENQDFIRSLLSKEGLKDAFDE